MRTPPFKERITSTKLWVGVGAILLTATLLWFSRISEDKWAEVTKVIIIALFAVNIGEKMVSTAPEIWGRPSGNGRIFDDVPPEGVQVPPEGK